MAYGTPRRARTSCLLHRHPARAAAERRAARRADPPLRGDRRAQPARRAHRGAACRRSPRRSTVAPGEFVVAVGLRHVDPSIEAAVDALAESGVEQHRRPRARPALLVDVRRRLSRAGRRSRRAARPAVRRHRELGERAGLRRLPGQGRHHGAAGMPPATRVLFTAHSLPRRILDTGDPYPDEVATTADARRRSGRACRPIAGRSPGSRRGGRRAMARAGPPRRDRRAGRIAATSTACWSARAASSPTTSRCSTTSISRPAGAPSAAGLVFRRTSVVNDERGVMAALARRIVDVARRHDAVASSSSAAGSPGSPSPNASARRSTRTTSASSFASASDRIGGALRTSPFAGRPAVDEGADAFLARVPHGTALAQRVGLGAELTSPIGVERLRCGTAACTASPTACCSACPATSPPWRRAAC